MISHLASYLRFCNNFHFRSFPLDANIMSCYVACLASVGRQSGTIQNHISSLQHFHQFYGFALGWEQNYVFKLTIRGAKRYLGMQLKTGNKPSLRLCCIAWRFSLICISHYMSLCGRFFSLPSFRFYVNLI